METDEFVWDDAKAASNLSKHRITFEEATFAFDDTHAYEEDDDSARYGEIRSKWIGSSGQRLLVVIYTQRGRRIRIISAREADAHEHAVYDQYR